MQQAVASTFSSSTQHTLPLLTHTPKLTCPPPPHSLLQLVRRWDPQLLLPAASPLLCHHHSVRTLAAGGRELLVSGDKNGEVALWKV